MTGRRGPTIPQRVRDVLITAIVTLFLVGGSGYFYTNHVQREADHRWCELLTILTGGPAPAPGPAGDRARVVGQVLLQLRRDLGC